MESFPNLSREHSYSTHKSALHVVITSNPYLLFQLSGEWSKLCGCSVCKLNVEFPVCHAKRHLIISASWGWNKESKSATYIIISHRRGGLNVILSSSVSLNKKDGISEPAVLAWHFMRELSLATQLNKTSCSSMVWTSSRSYGIRKFNSYLELFSIVPSSVRRHSIKPYIT